ncbi:MAG: sialidase family protein [Planctomycetota bacterium]
MVTALFLFATALTGLPGARGVLEQRPLLLPRPLPSRLEPRPTAGAPAAQSGPAESDVQVSTPSTANQNETSVAVNPLDANNLIGAANDSRPGDYTCAAYASLDGGQSWSELLAPVPSGYDAAGDPAVAFDNLPSGPMAFLCGLAFRRDLSKSAIFVDRSLDGGQSYPPSERRFAYTGSSGEFPDKEYLTVDNSGGPRNGLAVISWTNFESSFSQAVIRVVTSTDRGNSWSPRVRVSDGDVNQGSAPAVGPNGEVYVAWLNEATGTIDFDRSFDGGLTFGADITVASVHEVFDVPGFSFRSNSFPSLAVDTSSGPNRGTLYICWADKPGSHINVLCTRSTDGGTTWSAPILVNDDTNNRNQFFPWLTADAHGNVDVVFYDTRNAASKIDLYFARSSDGGQSFRANQRVTSVSFDPNTYGDGFFIGDYIGVAASDRAVHPLWTDGRNATNDIFTSRLHPDFFTDRDSLSAATGGAAHLTLNMGPNWAGKQYLIFGSVTGTTPGLDVWPGVHLPLDFDAYLILVYAFRNGPVFQNFEGTLDGQGSALATLDTLGPFDPLFSGITLYHAAVIYDPNPVWATNFDSIALVP